jgi:protein N-terminal glutamine amidohydrolase
MDAAALRADPAVYTACYCEENVANLARALLSGGGNGADYEELLVAFVSNAGKACPIWHQRTSAAAADADEPVVWDYHVVLLGRRKAATSAAGVTSSSSYEVLDLDSRLPFPAPARDYVAAAFRPHEPLRAAYRQRFRVVPAAAYLRQFASDRRHMRRPGGDAVGGAWSAPPPAYPPLRGPDAGRDWNLGAFWDVSEQGIRGDGEAPLAAPGEVLTLPQFMQRYCGGGDDSSGQGPPAVG